MTRRAEWASLGTQLWPAIVGLAAAIAFGAFTGAGHTWLASEPSGLWPSNLFYDLIIGVLVGVLGLIGLIGWTRGSGAGRNVVVGLLAFGVGWGAGATFGPRWQYPRDVSGVLTLRLQAPVKADLTGRATCTTEANGDRIVWIAAQSVGVVGVDEVGLQVQGLDPAEQGYATVLLNGLYGYEGELTQMQSSGDTLTGSASFAGRSEGARIGGPAGSATASGSFSWSCDVPGGPTPEPVEPTGGAAPPATPLVLQDAIEGYFDLHGLVEWVTCPETGPCQPHGHASGACSAALDLRTDGIETVVPWTDDRQARLHVVPGRDRSTLTVTLDDGSPPETVQAATTLTELVVGPWVGLRRVEGDFELAAGTLHLFVEWQCGDQFEHPES